MITACCDRCRRGEAEAGVCGDSTCRCHTDQLAAIKFAPDGQGYSVAVTINRHGKSFRFQVEYTKPNGSVAMGLTSWYPTFDQAKIGLEEYASHLEKEGWVRV